MVAGGVSPRNRITHPSQISSNRVAVTQNAKMPKRDNVSVKAGFQTPLAPSFGSPGGDVITRARSLILAAAINSHLGDNMRRLTRRDLGVGIADIGILHLIVTVRIQQDVVRLAIHVSQLEGARCAYQTVVAIVRWGECYERRTLGIQIHRTARCRRDAHESIHQRIVAIRQQFGCVLTIRSGDTGVDGPAAIVSLVLVNAILEIHQHRSHFQTVGLVNGVGDSRCR